MRAIVPEPTEGSDITVSPFVLLSTLAPNYSDRLPSVGLVF